MADWATLNSDMLGEILLKLDDLVDFISFSAVCRMWNHASSISSMVNYKWSGLPCLLLAENNNKENRDCFRKIFSLINNKCCQLKLPETFGARCWGSQYGWIVTLDVDLQLCLFNPLTKARIHLPPQSTMPNTFDDEDFGDSVDDVVLNSGWDKGREYARHRFVTKFLVIKDVENENENDDEFVVLAIVDYWINSLAFARPYDQTWTPIDPPDYTTEDDWPWTAEPPFRHRAVDFVSTGTRVLILYDDASLGYIDVSDLSKTNILRQPPKVKNTLPGIPKGLWTSLAKHHSKYLIAESSGDLLMVFRLKRQILIYDDNNEEQLDKDYAFQTTGFEVYRLNQDTKEWERLNKLDGIALFVGVSNSISLCASNLASFKSNIIYFTDDYVEHWSTTTFGGHDFGVFDFGSKQIDKFYKGDDSYSKFCPPLWFMPML